tara:strand:- start:312 stop:680 length:369 start_codon:yes stop_codon:yes gene_type:complete
MRYKVGDIVLVSSPAGKVIPNIHVKLLKRVEVQPSKGNRMDWPGYSGWEATPVYLEEINLLRKDWNIPFTEPEKDITFVYDKNIVKKPRKPAPKPERVSKNVRRRRRSSKVESKNGSKTRKS